MNEAESVFAQNMALTATVEALLALVAGCIGGRDEGKGVLTLLREDVLESVERLALPPGATTDEAALRRSIVKTVRSIFEAANLSLGAAPQTSCPHAAPGRDKLDKERNERDCLEAFIERSLRRLAERNYVPHEFLDLRERVGLIQAITTCVEGEDVKSEFLRVSEMGMADCSLEAAVVRHPDRFPKSTTAFARARLMESTELNARGGSIRS